MVKLWDKIRDGVFMVLAEIQKAKSLRYWGRYCVLHNFDAVKGVGYEGVPWL